MGIYIFEPAILNHIPLNQKLDLPDPMLNLLKAGQKVNVFKFDGYWLDIGRPDDYERAIDEFAKHRQKFIKE